MGGRRRPARSATVLSDRSAAKLIDLSTEIACVIAFDGRLEQISAGWLSEQGYAAGELGSTTYADLLHPDDRQETLERIRTLTRGRLLTGQFENRVRRRDGTYRQLRWHATVDRAEQRLYCLAQGPSGSEATVKTSGSRTPFDLMFDETDAAVVTDAEAVFTYVSPACQRLLGYAPEELVGKPMPPLIHPEDRVLAGIARKRSARTANAQTVSLRYRRKDGSYAWIESRSRSIIDPATGAMSETQSVMRDIGERKEAQLAMERQALTDALTGLANRTLLSDRLNQSLKSLKRNPGLVGVLMLDLDHFKVINDTLGHQIGDAVLVAAARRIQRLARPDDTVARFGGDEFVVVVQGLGKAADLSAFADRVVTGLREPYRIGSEEIVTTVSIGIAATSRPDHLPVDLLREADLALYQAKDRGRDRHEVYGEALQVRAVQRLETERLVRRAMAEHQLAVEYQPVVDLATGVTVEAEALVRVDDADLGRCMPDSFLSVSEEAGLLPAMDEWLRGTAFSQLATWRALSGAPTVERIAVNVTARELASADFVSRLAARFRSSGLEGRDVAIEVTEHVLMQTSHSAMSSLAELQSLGVRIGLDDFGTGFSALSYLQTFPLDFLKIDRSFIGAMSGDPRTAAIIAATIKLAHALGLAVVAVGIETEEQLAALRSFGCDRGQGFVFSPSLGAPEFARFSTRSRPAEVIQPTLKAAGATGAHRAPGVT